MRVSRGAAIQLVLLALVAGGITTAVALFPRWLPLEASKQAHRIDFVIWYVTIICIVIYAIVVGLLSYSVLHFRAAPDDESDGPPTHGSTRLEFAWTAIPFLIVTSIAIVCAIVLARNDSAGATPLHVDVTAQQFAWSFKYPESNSVTSTTLRLPVGRTTVLDMTSLDVIHAFFVPEFRQNEDVVPGTTTHLVVTPTRIGTYPLICNELCGLGHTTMRSTVVVMSQADFDTWVKSQGKATATGGATGGKAVFVNNGCIACHTLKAAGATGKIGPDLDNLPSYAAHFHQPLDVFIRTQVTHPDTFHQPGFPTGVMPHTFAALPKAQLDALIQFLIASSKGGK